MLKDGEYLLNTLYFSQGSTKPEREGVGRFVVEGGKCNILEDHHGVLSDSIPDGVISQDHLRTFFGLLRSNYYELVNKQDFDAGLHKDNIPAFDPHSGTMNVASYKIKSPDGREISLEIRGETVIIDGEEAPPNEAAELERLIESGQYKLERA